MPRLILVANCEGIEKTSMPTTWERTGQTKASLAKVIEYFMSPENSTKYHPKLVRGVTNVRKEGDTVTWEQHLAIMGMNFRSVARSALERATNTIQTESIEGSGKGTKMLRTMKEVPTGTEINWTYVLNLGTLTRLFVEGRARMSFEQTVEEDLKALDYLA
jgi:carbon monoxide dehydrogenase subunit G